MSNESLGVLTRFIQANPEFGNPDEPVSGSDAISRICLFWNEFRTAIQHDEQHEKAPTAPSYAQVVDALRSAIEAWTYLMPERYDGPEHQAECQRNLRNATRCYWKAQNALDALDSEQKGGTPS